MERLAQVARSLDTARSPEEIFLLVLQTANHIVRDAIGRSDYASTGRVLRSMVHVRPDDGYQNLVGLEANAENELRTGAEAHLPSSHVWGWVHSHRAPISLDVTTGVVLAREGDGFGEPRGGTNHIDLNASRMRLSGRDATHLLAVPLRLPGGRLLGMIAVEGQCLQARMRPFVWPACVAELEALAAVVAPFVRELDLAPKAPPAVDPHLPVIGPTMRQRVDMLRVFAKQEETVLLGGPTGAGKTRLAEWCHHQSPRREGPFETIDLASIPEDLQMAQLFGWVKGAYTGATGNSTGAITRAEKGTLFIDEIDKLSMKAQAGLLRVLESRRYRPLGEGRDEKTADVRFVVGTNADLPALSQKGLFREDLYYRVNVLPVRIPKLADRADEVIPWAQYMLDRRHRESGATGAARFAEGAAERLRAEPWPGNLRQLDNIVRRAYALALLTQRDPDASLVIEKSHVEQALQGDEIASPDTSTLALFERAAAAFAAEAERRHASGTTLDLELLSAMAGMSIDAAIRRIGGKEDEALKTALLWFGKESAVKHRNYASFYEKATEKVDLFRRTFGQPGGAR